MPEIVRSLLVVLFIATFAFQFSRAPLTAQALSLKDFNARRNAWFGITLLLFLSNNFWIFSIGTAVILLVGARKDSNPIAFAMVLLFAAPLVTDQVSGFGIANFLVELNYFRLISLCVFLPMAMRIRKEKGVIRFGGTTPEKFLICYMMIGLMRQILVDSSTNTMRSVLYLLTDVVLPYYVASRGLRNVAAIRDAMASFVMAAALAGAIGFFEFLKKWLLYSNIPNALGTEWGLGTYLLRGENLRGTASTGQAIVLGYVMAVAIGFYLFVSKSIPNKRLALLGYGVLGIGLLAPLSRGPWMGALLLAIVFVGTGQNAAKNLTKAAAVFTLIFLLALATPYGSTIVDHLPFIGTLESENVIYRERLFNNSMAVIFQNPWFGSYNFMSTPEMLELKSSYDGAIIDLVNSYIAIALSGGIISLAAFGGVFFWIVTKVYGAIKRRKEIDPEIKILLRCLLATLIAILFMIATVSSISFIPIIYWLVAGICISALNLVAPSPTK
ncbi:MAG: hypothetical protein ABIZ09_17350 [Rhodoferax sp.]